MKSQLIHQKSNFDFLIKIEFQRSHFIKTFKNMKLNHQEIKKVKSDFEKSKFSRQRKFSKCFKSYFFMTSCQLCTKMQDDSKKTSNMKVL